MNSTFCKCKNLDENRSVYVREIPGGSIKISGIKKHDLDNRCKETTIQFSREAGEALRDLLNDWLIFMYKKEESKNE